MTQLRDNGFKELRDKLYNVEIPVDDQIWVSIQDSMRRRRMRRVFYWSSSVAAAIVLALLVMWPSASEQGISPVAVAEVSKVEVPVEVAQESAPTQAIAEVVKVQDRRSGIARKSVQAAAVQVADVMADAVIETEASDKETVAETETEAFVEAEVLAETVAEVAQAADARVAEAAATVKNYNWDEEELWDTESYRENKVAMAFLTSVMPGSSASAVNSSVRLSQSGVGSSNKNDVVEQISDTKYSLPINVGIQAQLPLKGNLALGLGVSYSVISSRFDCLINKKKYSVKQSLHYIGIPVNIYGVVVERNRFSFYVNAGATVEKGLEAVYKLQSYTGNERFTDSIDGIQFSVNAGLGVEYKLANPAGIYFEPNMVYFFNSDVPRSMRTDQPLQVKGELGLRFHF